MSTWRTPQQVESLCAALYSVNNDCSGENDQMCSGVLMLIVLLMLQCCVLTVFGVILRLLMFFFYLGVPRLPRLCRYYILLHIVCLYLMCLLLRRSRNINCNGKCSRATSCHGPAKPLVCVGSNKGCTMTYLMILL